MNLLAIDKIETSIQPRYRMDQSVIDEYAEAMKAGSKFPPIDVFRENGSERYILVDGHHRLYAAMKNSRSKISANVHRGDKAAALHFALTANTEHGLRRSNADKRKIVLLAMNEPNYDSLSLREMGDLCRVSHELVRGIKQEINEKTDDLDDPEQPVEKKKPKNKKTNGEAQRADFQEAIAHIRTMPFPGDEAEKLLKLDDTDMEHVEAACSWLMDLLGWEAE